MRNVRINFDDVMLDWAIAELLSPTWATTWVGPACDELRRKIQKAVIDSLSVHERTWLVGTIAQCRSPIISIYGPCRSWSYERTAVPCEELRAFSIIRQFGYPSFSFGDLAAKIRDNPSEGEQSMRDAVAAILAQADGGKETVGLPIAVARKGPMPPLLIEGYKRSMAALWGGGASVAMFLCTP